MRNTREGRIALDAPLKVGRTVLPAHAEVHFADSRNGSSLLEAAARLAANVDRFNLAAEVRYRKQFLSTGATGPPGEVNLGLIGTGHIGDVRLRAGSTFGVSPRVRLNDAELSAYWSASDQADWEGDLAYDTLQRRVRAKITHVRRFQSIAVALTAEAASDRSVAFGVNLNFSLDPNHGLTFSRRPLAQAGAVHAIVYRDLNDNGLRDPSEPFEKGAIVTTGTVQADHPTNAKGAVTVGGLTAYMPVAVGLDQSSISDPMLIPKKALQVVVPRPGIPAEVQIPLVGGGDIEGAVIKSAELGFEGLDLELVDPLGKVIATARTDFDGFFLFERVPYGAYSIRIGKDSATAAKLTPELGLHVQVSMEKSLVRLGSIQARPLPMIASAGAVPAASAVASGP